MKDVWLVKDKMHSTLQFQFDAIDAKLATIREAWDIHACKLHPESWTDTESEIHRSLYALWKIVEQTKTIAGRLTTND
jgi:hypothetical protein